MKSCGHVGSFLFTTRFASPPSGPAARTSPTSLRPTGHRTLRIVGKGNQPALIPLAPRTARAIETPSANEPTAAACPDRRQPHRPARRRTHRPPAGQGAGIDKPTSPHSLRHAAITGALDAGCSLRDVQDFARNADPRQTRRYDRARGAQDRNP